MDRPRACLCPAPAVSLGCQNECGALQMSWARSTALRQARKAGMHTPPGLGPVELGSPGGQGSRERTVVCSHH